MDLMGVCRRGLGRDFGRSASKPVFLPFQHPSFTPWLTCSVISYIKQNGARPSLSEFENSNFTLLDSIFHSPSRWFTFVPVHSWQHWYIFSWHGGSRGATITSIGTRRAHVQWAVQLCVSLLHPWRLEWPKAEGYWVQLVILKCKAISKQMYTFRGKMGVDEGIKVSNIMPNIVALGCSLDQGGTAMSTSV